MVLSPERASRRQRHMFFSPDIARTWESHLAHSSSNGIFLLIAPLPVAKRRSPHVNGRHPTSKIRTRIQRPHYAKHVELSGHEPEKQDKVVALSLGISLSSAKLPSK